MRKMELILKVNKTHCCCLIPKLCLTLCDPRDCRLPGSSVHGISQARILEWVASSFSGRYSGFRDRILSATLQGFFTTEPLGKLPNKTTY